MRPAELPDFYLVGAPKCGTTAMYDFLRQHPDIFLPRTKELLLFGADLSYPTRLSADEFLAYFADRGDARRVGTAHTAYMQSRRAATEIKAARPDADIIIMLRNPIEVLPSWHSELLYETIEELGDFEAALEAEADRRRGKRVPRAARNSYVESLFYRDVVAFSDQVERYFEVFGRRNVHVIIHDDLRGDPQGVYREVLSFLRVDPTFEPQFAVINANKIVRSRALQKLYFGTSTPGHRTIRQLVPRALRQKLLAVNARQASRSALQPHVKARLMEELGAEIVRLSQLLDRDLTSWLDKASGYAPLRTAPAAGRGSGSSTTQLR
jgi:hypothetical protein